jgi:hypothetical protein
MNKNKSFMLHYLIFICFINRIIISSIIFFQSIIFFYSRVSQSIVLISSLRNNYLCSNIFVNSINKITILFYPFIINKFKFLINII